MSTERAARSLVTNFADLEVEHVRDGVSRCAIGTRDVIMVMNYIEPDMQPAPHTHDDFAQLAFIVSGHAVYTVSGIGHEVGPGSVLVIPAGEEHWIQPVGHEQVQNIDVFAPPRADYSHLLTWMTQIQS